VPNNGVSNVYAAIVNSPANTLKLDNTSTPSSITINTLALTAGTLNIGSGASLSLANQGSGITDISGGAGLILAGTFTTSGSTGALANLGSIEGLLTLAYQMTTVVPGSGILTNWGTISVQQTSTLMVNGNLTNSGAMGSGRDRIDVNNVISIEGMLTNSGSVGLIGSGDSLTSGSISNSGGIFLNGYGDTLVDKGDFTNTGGVGAETGSIRVAGNFYNRGSVSLSGSPNGASLFAGNLNNVGSVSVGPSGSMSVGNFYNASGASLSINGGGLGKGAGADVGAFNNAGIVTMSSDSTAFLTVGGPFTNSGLFSADRSSVRVGGGFNNLFGGTVTFGRGNLDSSGLFTNGGAVNVGFGGLLNANGGFTNSGAVTVASGGTLNANNTLSTTYSQTSGSTDVSGNLNASSYFQSGGGTTIEFGGTISTVTFKATGGTVTVNGTLDPTAVEFDAGSILNGVGTINGNVAMGGAIIPGAVGAPGILTINGNYEQIGTGVFDELIGGPQSNGLLFVNGAIALDSDASLQIVLLNGFNPLGDSFTLMDYNSLVGAFSSGTSFAADGYNWTLTYGSNDVVVTAVSATPEPGTLAMLSSGVLALCGYARRKKGVAAG